jgi:hypothetical protein
MSVIPATAGCINRIVVQARPGKINKQKILTPYLQRNQRKKDWRQSRAE